MARMTSAQKLTAALRLVWAYDRLNHNTPSGLCRAVFDALIDAAPQEERRNALRLHEALIATWPDRYTRHYAARSFPVAGPGVFYSAPVRMDDPRRQALLRWAKGRAAELVVQYEQEVQRGI